jgi:hypothetical protein
MYLADIKTASRFFCNTGCGGVKSLEFNLLRDGETIFVQTALCSDNDTSYLRLTPDEAIEFAEHLRFFAEQIKAAGVAAAKKAG